VHDRTKCDALWASKPKFTLRLDLIVLSAMWLFAFGLMYIAGQLDEPTLNYQSIAREEEE
jgi:hypothetical protein